jgi:hypothetical protein
MGVTRSAWKKRRSRYSAPALSFGQTGPCERRARRIVQAPGDAALIGHDHRFADDLVQRRQDESVLAGTA